MAGRILNRFAQDTYAIDDQLPFMLNIFLAQVGRPIGISSYGLSEYLHSCLRLSDYPLSYKRRAPTDALHFSRSALLGLIICVECGGGYDSVCQSFALLGTTVVLVLASRWTLLILLIISFFYYRLQVKHHTHSLFTVDINVAAARCH